MPYTKDQRKAYRLKNKDRLNAQARTLYWKDPEKRRAVSRRWYDDNERSPLELIEYIGKIYGMWKVVEEVERSKFGHRQFKVECLNCALTTVTANLSQLARASCCKYCKGRPRGEAGLKELYEQYKINCAKNKDRNFALSIDDFRKLTSSSCHYCGKKPSATLGHGSRITEWGQYIYNGIDRKDNSLGYTVHNCVPCCKPCNLGKHKMEYEEYVTYLNELAKYRTSLLVESD